MKQAHLSAEVQEFWYSTNNCGPGCGCDDDRFDMSSARVYEWKNSVDEELCKLVVEELKQISSPSSDTSLCEILSGFTNISFSDEASAKSWVNVWVQLFEAPMRPIENSRLIAWFDEYRYETYSQDHRIDHREEFAEIQLCYSGVLESSVDGRVWTQIKNQSKGIKPSAGVLYRFQGSPTIDDWDLVSLAQLSMTPGLVDLRLNDCNALTDEAIENIANVKSLQVLSIDSLQITGKTLARLRDLPNLKRLDISGCSGLTTSDIEIPGCLVFNSQKA